MKAKFALLFAVISGMFNCSYAANEATLSPSSMEKLHNIGLNIEHVENSPVSGVFTVVSKEGISYATENGDYIFTGNLFKVNGQDVENVTESALLKGVQNFANNTQTIDYKSPNEKYVIAIFTDITCGFCQKLHHDIAEYLRAGISIKYLAYPRMGLNSVVSKNMASIWCSSEPKKAFDEAMKDNVLPNNKPSKECRELIAAQFDMGSTMQLKGTPTSITLKGKPFVFTGYVTPESMAKQLAEQNLKTQ